MRIKDVYIEKKVLVGMLFDPSTQLLSIDGGGRVGFMAGSIKNAIEALVKTRHGAGI